VFEQALAMVTHPAGTGLHRNAADTERGKHAADIANQRFARDNHHDLGASEAGGLLEVQVRDPVQRDRGLAAARAALDDHHATVWLADQLELVAVDERGDLGQVLVGAAHEVCFGLGRSPWVGCRPCRAAALSLSLWIGRGLGARADSPCPPCSAGSAWLSASHQTSSESQ
jgi:hypothetical protein